MKLLNQILKALRCGSWCRIKPLKGNDPLVHINALSIFRLPSDHCLKTSSIFQLLQNEQHTQVLKGLNIDFIFYFLLSQT